MDTQAGPLSPSESSSNWRRRTSAPQTDPNVGKTTSLDPPSLDQKFASHRTPNPYNSRSGPPFNRNASTSAHHNLPDPNKDVDRRGNDSLALQAIEEGRRIYVGNMVYFAKVKDVEDLFRDLGREIERIDMSVDPFTGRNLSYCFVELKTAGDADYAIKELNGRAMLGRPLKVGPGTAKGSRQSVMARGPSGHRGGGGNMHGYGSTPKESVPVDDEAHPDPIHIPGPRSANLVFNGWQHTDAERHWKGSADKGRRLFVGGLPNIHDHQTANKDMRRFFAGFQIEAVSKIIKPPEAFGLQPRPGGVCYLFVDFATPAEAKSAKETLNGRTAVGGSIDGCVLGVQFAREGSNSKKVDERESWEKEKEKEKEKETRRQPKQASSGDDDRW